MKKKYFTPVIEPLMVQLNDVVRTSGDKDIIVNDDEWSPFRGLGGDL